MTTTRKPSTKKLQRDRWRQRVIDGMTPELSAELSPAEVMYLWAAATNGDRYFYSGQTIRGLREKGLLVRESTSDRLTEKGARWALRILDIYDAVPTGEGRYGWLGLAGYKGTVNVANGMPRAAPTG